MLTCRDQQAAAYKGSRKINRPATHPIHFVNTAAQTGAGTSFGANGDLTTPADAATPQDDIT